MQKLRLLLLPALVSMGLAATPAEAGKTWKFVADMKAEESTPVPGPPGATGNLVLDGDPETGKVCYQWNYNGPAQATDLHIHRAGKGVTGPVTIRLDVNQPCVDAEPAEVQALIDWPGGPEQGYYVDVHNVAYQAPNGAVRGQLFFAR